MFNKDQIMGFVRHGMTLLGGALIAMGIGDEGMWTELTGAAVSIAGVVWSYYVKVDSPPSA